MGLHKFAKYYYMPGVHEPGPSLEVIVNRGLFNKLPEDLQAIVRNAAQATAIETLYDFTFRNIETFGVLKKAIAYAPRAEHGFLGMITAS